MTGSTRVRQPLCESCINLEDYTCRRLLGAERASPGQVITGCGSHRASDDAAVPDEDALAIAARDPQPRDSTPDDPKPDAKKPGKSQER